MEPCIVCGATGHRLPSAVDPGIAKESEMATDYTSKKALYLNDDKSKVVAEGHPDAAFLLVGAGGTVTENELRLAGVPAEHRAKVIKHLSTVGEDDAADAAADAEAKAQPQAANKAVRGAPADKGVTVRRAGGR